MPTQTRHGRFTRVNATVRWRPRIAVSPCLHNLPLVHGLGESPLALLFRERPEGLGDLLASRKIDVALLGAIDLQRSDLKPLIIPAGGVASEGMTQNACIYSRMAPATIRQIHAGPESATAAMVARVLWAESFERQLQVLPKPGHLSQRITERPQAILLTGDEVNRPPGADYLWRTDLGHAWHSLTNLPLVFSVWTMQPDTRISPALQARRAHLSADLLNTAREEGMADIECLIGDYAARFGWDCDLARKYLTTQIQYKFATKHRRGLEMFFHLARKHGFIQKIRPLTFAV